MKKKEEKLPEKAVIKSVQVKFQYGDSGFCKDIFRSTEGFRLCRMETRRGGEDYAAWYTITDEDEPCDPVRRGLPVHVLDAEGNTVVTEQNEFSNGDFLAEKKFPFSWECRDVKDEATVSLIKKVYLKKRPNQ